MWVTDSSYRNKRIVGNVSRDYPVFLGPALFHFTKDEKTFTRFALELQAEAPAIRDLKKIGLDMEDAIFKGVKVLFPNVEQGASLDFPKKLSLTNICLIICHISGYFRTRPLPT